MNRHSDVEVLISCMNENDRSIVERTNIQSNVIIVNQCDVNKVDEWTFENSKGDICYAKMIYTTERGLSRSRNMAISNSTAKYCLICDDDEVLESNYEETIINSFEQNPSMDILAFNLINPEIVLPNTEKEISYWGTGKISSWQIAFRRNDLVLSSPFNIKMGSGTGNGGGEENKFLLDCMSKGARLKYIPSIIGKVAQTESKWFHGYDEKYWVNRGWCAKMLYGKIKGFAYIIGQLLLRVHKVDPKNPIFKIGIWMFTGFHLKR